MQFQTLNHTELVKKFIDVSGDVEFSSITGSTHYAKCMMFDHAVTMVAVVPRLELIQMLLNQGIMRRTNQVLYVTQKFCSSPGKNHLPPLIIVVLPNSAMITTHA